MATREFAGNLAKKISRKQLEAGEVEVADHQKLELELRQIFTRITFDDPSAARQAGNFDANFVPITTPSAVNRELAVAHQLGRIPVGIMQVMTGIAGSRFVGSLYSLRAWDATYAYLAVDQATDVNRSLTLLVW